LLLFEPNNPVVLGVCGFEADGLPEPKENWLGTEASEDAGAPNVKGEDGLPKLDG